MHPGGIPYYNWGYSKPKGIKYRCWFSCHREEPSKECKCSNSKYGKVVYLKPDYDLRMFPPVPRYSQAFKDKFKTRTSVERSNKGMFVDYRIEDMQLQSSKLKFCISNFTAINIHLDAWIKHLKFSFIATLG
ncbi:hypothetical protein [Tissierella pigra]|uniref:hypothetical protein n=1 Tax=Tissierella pigra TaxID=2607614 RepID=UPI001E2AE9E2|nr:hypothetical protein [Tissierella pigra]